MIRFGVIALLAAACGCSAGTDGDEADGSGKNTSGNGGGAHTGSGGSSHLGGAGASGPSGGGSSHAGEPSAAGGDDQSEAGTGGTGAGGKASAAAGSSAYGGASATNGAAGTTGHHTNPLSQALIDAFVKAHNDARASVMPRPSPELPPVTWDATLADSAYNYLMHCESSDDKLVSHNANRTKDYAALGGTDSVGENIYASNASSVTPQDAVNSWMSEASKYVPGDVSSAGHYTQVVWRDSVRIGCAIVNCPSLRFNNTVLCDYAPAGNIVGQMPYATD